MCELGPYWPADVLRDVCPRFEGAELDPHHTDDVAAWMADHVWTSFILPEPLELDTDGEIDVLLGSPEQLGRLFQRGRAGQVDGIAAAVLIRRHYLEGERFDQVAAELGLSKSWASRLHTRAIGRLTKRLAGRA